MCVSVHSTYQNIDRKRHQANKDTSFGAPRNGVLVLTGSFKKIKTEDCSGSKGDLVNLPHCAY